MLSFWKYGQRTEIAQRVGISLPNMSEILCRRRGVSKEKAKELEAASAEVLGYPIPFEAWLFNKSTRHPAFQGAPTEGE